MAINLNDEDVINEFGDFQEKLEKFTNDNPDKVFYFRGEHNNYPYSIPSIYRGNKIKVARKSDQFYSDLSVHLGDLNLFNLSFSNQLARFQHYEAPTRLLDITSNPLIALFFALENSDKNADSNRAIYFYAVNKDKIKYQDGHTVNMEVTANWMNQEIVDKFLSMDEELIPEDENSIPYEHEDSLRAVWDFMIELNLKNKIPEKMTLPKKIYNDLNRAYFVNFIRESTRMKTQQGAFIMPKYLTGLNCENGQLTDDLQKQVHDSIINSLDKNGFKKYIIPSKEVEKMRKDINALGVNAGSVYPDIKHYSQFLIDSYNENNY